MMWSFHIALKTMLVDLSGYVFFVSIFDKILKYSILEVPSGSDKYTNQVNLLLFFSNHKKVRLKFPLDRLI